MIKIELKRGKTASGAEINYVELCHACLNSPARQGFDIQEMKLRLKAVEEFPLPPRNPDGSPGKLLMDHVEVSTEVFQELLSCVRAFRWSTADQVIVDFVDYIESLAKPKVKK